ncbi:OrdA protein [Crucibulum laeve]|uniref:OrdA protein n=1 Tax=Crucibulum laeve TaxID=68775 RepID=A0A5C3LJ19_9AGAR|nr:OrdA protein [Crucibulum laeve]
MGNALTAIDIALAAFGLYLLHLYIQRPSQSVPYPPGPKGLPLVGNVADVPKQKEWLTYAEWGRKWGGICSIKLLGRSMIIVNSADVMDELDKKGAIYSNRPRLEMGGELVGYSETLVLIPYGERFRTYRKHFAQYIGSGNPIQNLHPLIELESHKFLKRVLADHTDLLQHLRKLAGGIILGLTYGYEVQENQDPFVNLIEHANDNFNVASVPGNFLVDFFPVLLQLPEWLPGMGFLETARKWAKDTAAMVEVPFAYTKKQIEAGAAPPSFISTILQDDINISGNQLRDLKFTAASMYGGGADTTVSAEYAFFLAMVLNPAIQKKAQAEIDSVIGSDRLPSLADRPNLPYLNAVVTEVLRWNSVAPTGVPHTATEDGIVAGWFVPKGAIILANLWNMLHDPQVYPEPFNFDPERHIAQAGKPAQRDPRNVCFGYGRRICPGMYLAEASLFSCVAMSLAVFDITKTIENGVTITPVHENTSGTISYPEPFKCTIKPRSAKALSLIAEDLH